MMSRLLFPFAICLLLTVSPVASYGQQCTRAFTKEGILSSLRKKELRKDDMQFVAKQMQRCGVNFRPTLADVQEIRRLGKYLGKKGLDDLVAAVRINYRADTSGEHPSDTRPIQTIMVEGRLTCDLKEGAEIPPAEVPFIPVGDANAYLEGPLGKVALNFVSPVRFRRQEDNSVVIINRFSLPNGSDLQNRPVESLKAYEVLVIPSVTIVWGKSMTKIKFFEVAMTINGQDVWYYPYRLNAAFEWEKGSPMFRIPLDTLREKLDAVSKAALPPPIQQPEFPIERITIAPEAIPSPREDLPFGLRVTIQSTVPVSPVHFLVECSGPIGHGSDGPVGGGVMTEHFWGWEGNKYEFKYESPALTPQRPAQVLLFSAKKISCSVVRIR
ncbi:MAG TPA: hypothetical protein VGB98_17705 [Pyrinomonadaceae bacterium]|jgi:hypothetical protein